jgi:hypothetical protein
MLINLILTIGLIGASEKASQPRSVLKKQIFDGCMALSTQVPNRKKDVCDCVVANCDLKLGDVQLETIAKNYDPKNKNKSVLNSALATFDGEVAEQCIVDPKWRIELDID